MIESAGVIKLSAKRSAADMMPKAVARIIAFLLFNLSLA
jgi:hypothetical protein